MNSKCIAKIKKVLVGGLRYDPVEDKMENFNFVCIVTNDSIGKTLSVTDKKVQFIIPFEPLEKYLR